MTTLVTGACDSTGDSGGRTSFGSRKPMYVSSWYQGCVSKAYNSLGSGSSFLRASCLTVLDVC